MGRHHQPPSIRYYSPDGSQLWGDDVVIEADRPRKLVMGWRSLYDPEEQPGGVCRLTVTHDQLEAAPKTATSVSGGWMFIISGLKTVVETGEPLRLEPPVRG